MADGFLAKLKGLNTHAFFWGGLAIAFPSMGLIGAHQQLDTWAVEHLGMFGGFVKAYIDGGYTIAFYVVFPAIVSAALGRPWFIQERPGDELPPAPKE